MADSSGAIVAPLDTRFEYTPDEVRRDFARMGASGREAYRVVVGRIDMIFPLAYGSFLLLVLLWFLKKSTPPMHRWPLLAFLPIHGVVADYFENFAILKLLDSFPQISNEAVARCELLTQLKHGLLILSPALALVLGIVLILQNIGHEKPPA